jgi:hypothetical protein
VVLSKRAVQQLRDATIELLGVVLSVRAMQRLYNKELLRLETTVRKVVGWCEMAASLAVSQLEQ